jgi:hypothetical protein
VFFVISIDYPLCSCGFHYIWPALTWKFIWEIRAYGSATPPPAFIAGLRDLQESVSECSRPDNAAGWRQLIEAACALNAQFVWNTEAAAETGLHASLEAVRKTIDGTDRAAAANTCLHLVGRILSRWVASEPEASARIIEEAEPAYLPSASPGEQQHWKWSLATIEEQFHGSAFALPATRRKALDAKADAWLARYWMDDSVPLDARTYSVTLHGTCLYASGNASASGALLDYWISKHGNKPLPIGFYAARFFTAYLGQGDVETARRMISRADALVREGIIPRDDPHYAMMTQCYYTHLFASDAERSDWYAQLLSTHNPVASSAR